MVWSVAVVSLHARPAQSLAGSGAVGDHEAGECFEFPELFHVSLSPDAPGDSQGPPVKECFSHAFPERVYTPYSRGKRKRKAIKKNSEVLNSGSQELTAL